MACNSCGFAGTADARLLLEHRFPEVSVEGLFIHFFFSGVGFKGLGLRV